MRILHLFSNWKWTGPAEHALHAATFFAKRGHDLIFACGKPPADAEDSLEMRAMKSGLNHASAFYLNKHVHIWQDAVDVVRLTRFIKKEDIDLIHTHLFNDHFVAGVAARCLSKRVFVVRTVYDGLGLRCSMRNRLLLSHLTDGLIVVSEASKDTIKRNFHYSSEKMWTICPGVDCDRFNPCMKGSNVRKRFGIGLGDPVVGIVARVQPHRRFEIFLKSIEYAVKEVPRLKIFIIGRGTHIQEVAMKPVEALGLQDHVVFTGYRLDDYTDILAALDIKVFLVPGSDGSCRAVREAMAMGIPVIVANRGMLPEIVEDGMSGMVVEDTPENLGHAIVRLATDAWLRKKMGEAARKRMVEYFNLDTQLEKIEGVYETFRD